MRTASRTGEFTESVIREMTRLINMHHPQDGINLAQGFPDFPVPAPVKDAACAAIQQDVNQYAVTWGSPTFRRAIAAKTQRFLGLTVDADREITVCCGATETMVATLLAVLNPDDAVIIFEPFYENYGPGCIIAGARPHYIRLHPPHWDFDRDELAASITSRTRAIIVNTPNNPTGKVFNRDDLSFIAGLCQEHDLLAITDEIYEHIIYDGRDHVAMATLPGMRERTVTINGLSKTYSVTGWRVGYAIAPPDITDAIRKVHDFLTVGAAAPLQEGGVVAMSLPPSYYDGLRADYQARRDFMVDALTSAGFGVHVPEGAYYIMAEIDGFGFTNDVAFAQWLVEDVGLAVVPGSSFYHEPDSGTEQVRFAFPKRLETLERAAAKLASLRDITSTRLVSSVT